MIYAAETQIDGCSHAGKRVRGDLAADRQVSRLELAQHLGVAVADPRDAARARAVQRVEQHGVGHPDDAVARRDRIAVRVARRMPELLVDVVEQPVAHRVLEHLGLVVHLVPPVAVLRDEPGLDQPVPAHHARAPLRAPDR